MRRSHLAAGMALAALAAATVAKIDDSLPPMRMGKPSRYPSPKSTHKRKFKGSKAARKSSRKPKI